MTATARPDIVAQLEAILDQLDDATADTVLSLLRQIRDTNSALPAGGATEATLLNILAQLDDATASTVLSVLKEIAADTDLLAAVRDRLPAAGAASEAKLEAVRALLAGNLNVSVTNPTDVSPLARETTLARKFGSGKITRGQAITLSGDTAAVTPAPGNRVRLFWVGMSTSESNVSEVLVQIKFGTTVHYRWRMGSPGAFSHWEVIEGGVNQPLVVNLDQPMPVEFNVTYEEFA